MDYSRQQRLLMWSIDSIMIIGVGGLGSWVAITLALTGQVSKIYICDDDTVEESNLNRTLFRQKDIGKKKVKALRDIIAELRPEQIVFPLDIKFQINDELPSPVTTVIDCSDNLNLYKNYNFDTVDYCKGGYDGYGYTLYLGQSDDVWDIPEQAGYNMVSSYVVPPQIMAGIITELLINVDTHHYVTRELLHSNRSCIINIESTNELIYNYYLNKKNEKNEKQKSDN